MQDGKKVFFLVKLLSPAQDPGCGGEVAMLGPMGKPVVVVPLTNETRFWPQHPGHIFRKIPNCPCDH